MPQDYPYATDFMAPLPGWPVNASCSAAFAQSTPVEALAAAAGLFYNGTAGNLKCYLVEREFVGL